MACAILERISFLSHRLGQLFQGIEVCNHFQVLVPYLDLSSESMALFATSLISPALRDF